MVPGEHCYIPLTPANIKRQFSLITDVDSGCGCSGHWRHLGSFDSNEQRCWLGERHSGRWTVQTRLQARSSWRHCRKEPALERTALDDALDDRGGSRDRKPVEMKAAAEGKKCSARLLVMESSGTSRAAGALESGTDTQWYSCKQESVDA